MEEIVNIIGGGLAGVEAAHQLSKNKIKVNLYEMRPVKMTDAHSTGDLAELVCSNSLRADGSSNAVGILKQEMEMLDSIVIKFAREHSVPAGGALAVDRINFSKAITEYIENNEYINLIREEITNIPKGYTIIASGPLTSENLSSSIQDLLGEDYFYFFDAAAPIIEKDSIDFNVAYYKSRYDKGGNEYINCPMTKEQFDVFYEKLINAPVVKPKQFEEKFFEGCMPFEEIARRGPQTLLFGPMKPVGLTNPDGSKPHAVVQLRQDNAIATLYNIVGFQTHLTWDAQKEIIHMIPGLQNASIVRYGVMHKNSYICSPKFLKTTYQLKSKDNIMFAGQITGVEGYVESAQSGIVAGLNMARIIQNKQPLEFPKETVMGALSSYIVNGSLEDFQPMKANFGILPELGYKTKKKERKEKYATRALQVMSSFIDENEL